MELKRNGLEVLDDISLGGGEQRSPLLMSFS